MLVSTLDSAPFKSGWHDYLASMFFQQFAREEAPLYHARLRRAQLSIAQIF
jgi:hypothetical protein